MGKRLYKIKYVYGKNHKGFITGFLRAMDALREVKRINEMTTISGVHAEYLGADNG